MVKQINFAKFRDWFEFPALVIHEIWHIVFAILVGGKISSIRFYPPNRVRIKVLGIKSLSRVRLVALSPCLSLIISFVLPLIFGPVFFLVCLYFVLAIRTTLPSYLDFQMSELTPPVFYGWLHKETFEQYLLEKEVC
jgi:hypothetical protein